MKRNVRYKMQETYPISYWTNTMLHKRLLDYYAGHKNDNFFSYVTFGKINSHCVTPSEAEFFTG